MKNLHFKTPLYNIYAPYLYKIKQQYSHFLAWKWGLNSEQLSLLKTYIWDQYLSKKLYSEVPHLFGKPFKIKKIKKKYKKSDTIFILGCGNSINDLSEEDWLKISKFDSIGVNYFYSHYFMPTFHMIELGASNESAECLNTHLLNLEQRKSEQVFVHLRHLLSNDKIKLNDKFNNLHLYSPSILKGTSKSFVKKIIDRWYGTNNTLIHHASNLDCTIHFAYQMGYKNIYLLGVDLNNNQYFWDTSDMTDNGLVDVIRATDQDYNISNFNRDPKAVHATMDKETTSKCKSFTIIEYLKIVNEQVFKKNNINFATCTSTSLLTKYFKYINLKNIN